MSPIASCSIGSSTKPSIRVGLAIRSAALTTSLPSKTYSTICLNESIWFTATSSINANKSAS